MCRIGNSATLYLINKYRLLVPRQQHSVVKYPKLPVSVDRKFSSVFDSTQQCILYKKS